MRLWKAYHFGMRGRRRVTVRGTSSLLFASLIVLGPASGDARLGDVATHVYATEASVASGSAALDSPSWKAPAEDYKAVTVPNSRRPAIRAQVADLLQLAEQLQSAVKKTNKDMLSLTVVRKADAIEKLARAMKTERTDHGYGTH